MTETQSSIDNEPQSYVNGLATPPDRLGTPIVHFTPVVAMESNQEVLGILRELQAKELGRLNSLFGQTGFYDPTIEKTPPMRYTFDVYAPEFTQTGPIEQHGFIPPLDFVSNCPPGTTNENTIDASQICHMEPTLEVTYCRSSTKPDITIEAETMEQLDLTSVVEKETISMPATIEGSMAFEVPEISVVNPAIPKMQKPLTITEGDRPLNVPVSAVTQPVVDGLPTREPTSTLISLTSDVKNLTEPMNYHIDISISKDRFPFKVDLDTGSTLLWVKAQLELSDEPVVTNGLPTSNHDHGAQTLYQPDPDRYLDSTCITYGGSHSPIEFQLYEDTVWIGGFEVEKQIVGAVSMSNLDCPLKDSNSSGLLGLGFPVSKRRIQYQASAMENRPFNLLQQLKMQQLSQGNQPISWFTLVPPRTDPKLRIRHSSDSKAQDTQRRGHFVIGDLDPRIIEGKMVWCDVVPDYQGVHWVIKLDGLLINGNECLEEGQYAMIDTGTSFIIAPCETFNRVVTAFPDAKPFSQDNTHFTYDPATLHSIQFLFNGQAFDLQPQDHCLAGVTLTGNRKLCSIHRLNAVHQPPPGMWVIGGIFLDNIITVFDFEHRRVGFAKRSHHRMRDSWLPKLVEEWEVA